MNIIKLNSHLREKLFEWRKTKHTLPKKKKKRNENTLSLLAKVFELMILIFIEKRTKK